MRSATAIASIVLASGAQTSLAFLQQPGAIAPPAPGISKIGQHAGSALPAFVEPVEEQSTSTSSLLFGLVFGLVISLTGTVFPAAANAAAPPPKAQKVEATSAAPPAKAQKAEATSAAPVAAPVATPAPPAKAQKAEVKSAAPVATPVATPVKKTVSCNGEYKPVYMEGGGIPKECFQKIQEEWTKKNWLKDPKPPKGLPTTYERKFVNGGTRKVANRTPDGPSRPLVQCGVGRPDQDALPECQKLAKDLEPGIRKWLAKVEKREAKRPFQVREPGNVIGQDEL